MKVEGATGECEYCSRADVVRTYAWRADEWCRDCALAYGCDPKLLDAAPLGRPEHASYEIPFVLYEDAVVELLRRLGERYSYLVNARQAVEDQLLVRVVASQPWALHALATLPGWRAFAESVRR